MVAIRFLTSYEKHDLTLLAGHCIVLGGVLLLYSFVRLFSKLKDKIDSSPKIFGELSYFYNRFVYFYYFIMSPCLTFAHDFKSKRKDCI